MVSTLPPETGGDFELAPEGNHVAVCYRIVDLGTHNRAFMNEPPKPKRQIMISWELPSERMKDGKPFSVHGFYNWSTHKKASLRQDLEAWRGKAFTSEELGAWNIKNILGAGCMLQVQHSASGFANVTTIARLPRGMKAPEPENEILFFDLDDFDPEVYGKLSKKTQEKIALSPEYRKAVFGGQETERPFDVEHHDEQLYDEIPF